jgi:hypothetical protein
VTALETSYRESAAGKTLEPHGLTLVIFPAPGGGSCYGVTRPGLPGGSMRHFQDLNHVEAFTACLTAGPPFPPAEAGQEWRENCPRCWHPFTASTEADMLRRLLDHITYQHLIPAQGETP